MKKILITAIVVLSFSVFADINISNNNVTETFTNTVKVSGNFHLGVQYAGTPNLDELYVNIPKGSKGLLCVKLASIDGKYKAELKHPLAGDINGLVKINFASKFKNELSNLSKNEMAVLAMVGKDCQYSKSDILIGSWQKNIEGLSPFLLIRSDARIDEVHAPSIENTQFKVKCKKFNNAQKVTFDKYCNLSGLDLNKYSTFEVKRKHFRAMKNERINLSL